MDTVVVRVPATIANLGSGFDAIGLALSWHNEVRIERRRDDVVVVSGVGDLANGLPRDSTNLIVRSLESVMGPLRSITVNQIVAMPMGRGFGSRARRFRPRSRVPMRPPISGGRHCSSQR